MTLGLDELEAIRLADVEGLYHQQAAQRMAVSRATFGRILASARRKVAEALVEGWVLAVGEGPVIPVEERPCGSGSRRHGGGRGGRCRSASPVSVETDASQQREGGSDR